MPTPPLTPPDKLPSGVTPAPPLPPRPAPGSQPGRPLQPRTPTFISSPVEPETAATPTAPEVETESEAQEENSSAPADTAYVPLTARYSAKAPAGMKRKCPNCLYFPMLPLAEFEDKDIEKTYRGGGEYYYQTRPFYHIIPFSGLLIRLLAYLGNLLFASASDAGKRAKAHRAKAEILARCPNSLICPECCEVLEIY